jgi:hypothetical protein
MKISALRENGELRINLSLFLRICDPNPNKCKPTSTSYRAWNAKKPSYATVPLRFSERRTNSRAYMAQVVSHKNYIMQWCALYILIWSYYAVAAHIELQPLQSICLCNPQQSACAVAIQTCCRSVCMCCCSPHRTACRKACMCCCRPTQTCCRSLCMWLLQSTKTCCRSLCMWLLQPTKTCCRSLCMWLLQPTKTCCRSLCMCAVTAHRDML